MLFFDRNPRSISPEKLDELKSSILDLGDLSGIVHDLNSDMVIGGNQRMKIIGISSAKVELIETYKKPTKTGTVGYGYIIFEGERFSYRQVKWSKEQCERACIIANKAGGDWDFDRLATDFEKDVLSRSGFSPDELPLSVSPESPDKTVEADVLEERKEPIQPYRKVHVLLSFPPDRLLEIKTHVDQIILIEGVEVEQSAN